MDKYFVEKQKQPNGDNLVHKENCPNMPEDANRRFLGIFNKCRDAITEAKREYPQSNGCNECIPECHKS